LPVLALIAISRRESDEEFLIELPEGVRVPRIASACWPFGG
jgi:hypothetical protein